jgi:hypothetical protein
MVPFPCPVVPEVNAISATSSAAVLTFRKVAGLPAILASRVSGPSPPKQTTR